MPEKEWDYNQLDPHSEHQAKQKDGEDSAFRMWHYGLTIACDKHRPTGKPCIACDHCVKQDEVHPDGIILTNKFYFICTKCLSLIEKHKFDFYYHLKTACRSCIQDEIKRITLINPELFIDGTIPPK